MSSRTVNSQLQATTTVVALSQNSSIAQLDRIDSIDVTAVIAGSNGSNKTFVDGDVSAANDTISEVAHGYETGMKITELTTTGVLPAGLALSTVYYVIKDSADLFKVATSQANALAGTAVNITAAAGGGTHTVVVATTLAGTLKLQKNNNPPDVTAVWFDLNNGEISGSSVTNSQTISAAGTFNWSVASYTAREMRVVSTITSGMVTADIRVHGKGRG